MRRQNDTISSVVFVLGLLALPFVAYKEHQILDDWVTVEGQVIECWSEPDWERDRSDFFCKVGFQNADPLAEHPVNPLSGPSTLRFIPFVEPYKRGDRIEVFYPRGNPREMDVKTFPTSYPFSFVLGIIVVCYPLGRVLNLNR
jgi:hypothetical protein